MVKIGLYMVWLLGDSSHKGSGVGLQFLNILHHSLSTNALFQVVIEIFIRIVFRGIGWQKEKRNFILVIFNPLRNLLAVMNSQIIKDKIHFPPVGCLDQGFHKPNQTL